VWVGAAVTSPIVSRRSLTDGLDVQRTELLQTEVGPVDGEPLAGLPGRIQAEPAGGTKQRHVKLPEEPKTTASFPTGNLGSFA